MFTLQAESCRRYIHKSEHDPIERARKTDGAWNSRNIATSRTPQTGLTIKIGLLLANLLILARNKHKQTNQTVSKIITPGGFADIAGASPHSRPKSRAELMTLAGVAMTLPDMRRV
jgi:hypothetical protein